MFFFKNTALGNYENIFYDFKINSVNGKVINFNDIGNNIGNFFKEFDINIKCNKQAYDDNSQNVHYRKNKKTKPTNWWFDGKKSQEISKYLDKKFLFLKDLL